jgi:ribonuclease R
MTKKPKTTKSEKTDKATKSPKNNKTQGRKIPANFQSDLKSLLLQNPGKAFSIKHLFRHFKLNNKTDKLKLVEDLEVLAFDDVIVMTPRGDFTINAPGKIVEGVVDFVNPRYAFIISDDIEKDIWVNSDDLKFALDGDRVKVNVYPTTEGRRPEGEVIEIVERSKDEFVGKIELSERYAFVVVDNKKMHLDIFVPNNATKQAQHGDKVIVKIKEWHDASHSPVGMVIEVLGKAGTHHTEMHAILAEFGLPLRFPENVLAETEKIRSKVTASEINKRRDFRQVLTFTIDPVDAKDFDDALSIRLIKENLWEIGVHIADVTHYVRPGTELEKEALKRATSVYLVDRVIPMLPEKLSNELCSLRPNEDRLTFSAVFEMDNEANVLNQWFGRTVIHSNKRFSYEDAQECIETGEGEYAQEIRLLNTLAKKMTERRFKSGAINFETTEVKFKLDETGKPIGIYLKERKDAHRLIEEFMLLANKKVAEFVFNLKEGKSEKTMVYRIHEKPDMDKLQNFSAFARKFGYDMDLSEQKIAASINHLVEQTTGTPQQDVLQSLAIRTMAKARYSIEPVGHFGLAFKHYTHFTSPIRRYPDMMVHRLLQRYLEAKRSVDKDEYEKHCRHSTDMEKRAADAERASTKYKQVEFMKMAEDKDYNGVVTGVTEWGVYVEIIETKCEGMVRMVDITDDFFELDAENYRIVGKKTKKIITFGDAVKVQVKNTNLENRTMDLVFVK